MTAHAAQTEHTSEGNVALPTPGALYAATKRLLDIFLALAGFAVTLPLMACCAIWIKLIDPGPVLYTQWRVGHDGWLFRIYKLRTMGVNAETPGTARWASRSDSRILPGCGWMRRSHIDELPQLWNILIGDMSLVGPRPERPEMIEQLRDEIPDIDDRHAGKPGLTGLAQVRNGYTNDVSGARTKLLYDLRYLRDRSIVYELFLILRTIPKFWDRGSI